MCETAHAAHDGRAGAPISARPAVVLEILGPRGQGRRGGLTSLGEASPTSLGERARQGGGGVLVERKSGLFCSCVPVVQALLCGVCVCSCLGYGLETWKRMMCSVR